MKRKSWDFKQYKPRRNPRGGLLIPLSAIGAAYRHTPRRMDNNPIRATLTLNPLSNTPATIKFTFLYPENIED